MELSKITKTAREKWREYTLHLDVGFGLRACGWPVNVYMYGGEKERERNKEKT